MATRKPLPEAQGRMSYQPAKLGKAQGYSVARLERIGEASEQTITGTFKGERTFFQAYAHTSSKMTYKGFVEHEGLIYYAVVRVHVEVRTRQAKFRAVSPPTIWHRITDA